MNIQTKDTRQHIIDTGYELIVAKGFSNVGLSQLLKHAEVPKGSFYHYFKSKEQFGEALIADYFSLYAARLDELFESNEGQAYDRLISYWQRWIDISEGKCGAQKCLVVKLSAEVSDLSDSMRVALLTGANRIIQRIAECIEQGNADGSMKVEDSQKSAELLYNLWIGTSLMSKLSHSLTGFEQVMTVTQNVLTGKMKL